MVSCWYFLCSGLLCLAHTREMFTSLWRSSNHLELSRQPEGPGLRCHLFYYIYIKYIIFTINSINENRCCISILQLWEIAVGHEDVYVHSSLIKKVTPPFNQSSPMNRKWFPILFFQWDLCAGAAILNSLGGRMTDIDGKEIHFDDESDFK